MIMENFVLPFVTAGENIRSKRIERSLNSLNTRLKQLRQQHEEILQKSASIMQEIDEVTTSVDIVEMNLKSCSNSISESFLKFNDSTEKVMPGAEALRNGDFDYDDGIMLKSTKQLKEGDILRESLSLLKRTKESLEKFENFLYEVVSERQLSQKKPHLSTSKSFVKFQLDEPFKSNSTKSSELMRYSSCCDSDCSLKNAAAANFERKCSTDQLFYDVPCSITDVGFKSYKNDSDYDDLQRVADKRIRNSIYE